MYDREKLIELFRERALKFGDFTLASGKKSTYYLDGKQVVLHSHGLRQVSAGLLELLGDTEFDAIGGMSIGADPIVAGVLAIAAEQGRALNGFMVRKEAKGHGTNKYVEGPVKPGDKVVIVDDVITTAGSALLSVDRAEEFGCKVIKALGVVDRLQGGAANFAKRNIPFESLLSIVDFGIDPPAEDE
ncbi:orotate phosphoribosyltransferase [Gimesia sp.]|uniref:orotate phosphoribosyltransferase n=1 Tax=Gimesia sp. TaxID=2024833 RepID=UPI000C60300C|nr:orotate phosphoribosyltransferase [Gimesia sp.]MAX36827.1 orotate phosphoribosyltransferase [Gimesia sp.]HAH46448.1 orotate phosphoribosyltransferase [Planctomycetaceae bacterium]HBL46389.1 orotate phosphoribosyltransferase [Planctomycetaceae bacterium]|tara:strand:- start:6079 stop:6639 length:561 start_codon:yes stop_codon:yes gene_type:complete